MKRLFLYIFLLFASFSVASAEAARTLVVLPFENTSKAPGIEWISEAFPEVLGQRFSSAQIFVISREDRLYAFDRAGIPTHIHPSRATLYRIAEQMDADLIVLGSYNFDGETFTAIGQVLDVKNLKLTPEIKESGPLVKLLDVQAALAWDLVRVVDPQFAVPRDRFIAAAPAVRLDAFENYIRGIIAPARQDKLRYFREAVRLSPNYTAPILQLGRTYFANREYEAAASWFARVAKNEPAAREAGFFAGLSYYYIGDFNRAQQNFSALSKQIPLIEVFNNLGVVEARRGRRAVEYFQKAVQTDPNDPDYRFNFALSLYRAGDLNSCVRELREVLKLKHTDAEAKQLLDNLTVATPNRPPNAPAAQIKLPLERIKRNYDENSFRQLALEIQNAQEMRLAKSDPRTHAAAHAERGRELLGKGLFSEADHEFREALATNANDAAAHAGLAQVLENNNDAPGARNEARASLRLQPNAIAYIVLANLDLKDNNPGSAAENVNRALALEPNNQAARALQRAIGARLTDKAPSSGQPE